MKGRPTLELLRATTTLNYLLIIHDNLSLIITDLFPTVLSQEMNPPIGLRQTLKVAIIKRAFIDLNRRLLSNFRVPSGHVCLECKCVEESMLTHRTYMGEITSVLLHMVMHRGWITIWMCRSGLRLERTLIMTTHEVAILISLVNVRSGHCFLLSPL